MNNGNVKREELPKSALGGLSNGNSRVLDEAKQAVTHVAGEVTEQAKDKVNATLGAQKEKAATSIAGVADAIREGGRSLREHDTAIPSEYADRAADQIERIGSYLRNRTLGELVGDAESFARREPAIFFGGAFALGLLTARFLKSSGTHSGPQAPQAGGDRNATSRQTAPLYGSLSHGAATSAVSNTNPTPYATQPMQPMKSSASANAPTEGKAGSSAGSASSASTSSSTSGSTSTSRSADTKPNPSGGAGGSTGGL